MSRYLLKIKKYIILSIIYEIILTISVSLMIYMPGYLIDNYKKGFNFILKLSLIYLVTFIIYLFFAYVANRNSDKRRYVFELSIKNDFFKSLINKNYQEFSKYHTDEYISMQTNDITELCTNYLSPLMAIYNNIIMICIFGVVIIIFVDLSISAVIISLSAFMVFVPKLTEKKLANNNSEWLKCVARYAIIVRKFFESFMILDTLSKIKLIKKNREELKKVMDANMEYRKINSLAMVINGGAVEAISVVSFIMIAYLLVINHITVGMAMVGFMYCNKFIDPMYRLNQCIGQVKSTKFVQKKLLSFIEYNDKNIELENYHSSVSNMNISVISAKKVFDCTCINYPKFKFTFPNKYLIEGDNGSGKSVLLKAIMKFIKLDEGSITYECIDINEDNVVDFINYIPQNQIIYDAGYEDNISIFGTYNLKNLENYEKLFPKIIIDKIKRNNNFSTLSGGEGQIVCLLRALCSEKKVLIMDEPFSAMNKHIIREFLKNVYNMERLIIIVAHNVEEKDFFDDIFYMEGR